MTRGGFLMNAVFSLAVLIMGDVTVEQAAAEGVHLAQSSEVMQCMERCLRSEGGERRDTCKSRCADISSHRSQRPDCMMVYKLCLKPCGTNKTCRRACKKKLMNCS